MNPRQLTKQLQDTRAEEVLITALNAGGEASLADIQRAVGDETRAIEYARTLRSMGLVRTDTTLAGEVALTSTGMDVAELIKDSRRSGAARRAAVQRRILQWLARPNSYPASTEEFLNTADAVAYEVPFTEQEITDETVWLLDINLIKGTKTWGGVILRPEITSLGRDALDSGERPGDFLRTGNHSTAIDQSTHSINVAQSQNLAIQQGGLNNSQHAEQSNQQHWNVEVAAYLETLLEQLSADDSVNASELAELRSIKVEVESASATRETIMSKFLSWSSRMTHNPLIVDSITTLMAMLGQ